MTLEKQVPLGAKTAGLGMRVGMEAMAVVLTGGKKWAAGTPSPCDWWC